MTKPNSKKAVDQAWETFQKAVAKAIEDYKKALIEAEEAFKKALTQAEETHSNVHGVVKQLRTRGTSQRAIENVLRFYGVEV